MKASLQEVLEDTRAASPVAPSAVASFNVVDFDLARAVVAAAEETGRPVVLGIAARHWEAVDVRRLAPALASLIASSRVPIALHLDHVKPADVEMIHAALGIGFTSIMIDGSRLPFEENVQVTRAAVDLARGYAAGVEGELGSIAGEEGVADQREGVERETVFTDPEAAERFVSATGVAALAVAVGTAHGLYTREPNIRFDIIRGTSERVEVPLVLHGATGVSDEDIRESIRCGIRKINFFSGFLVAASEVLRGEAQRNRNDFVGFKAELFERWKRTALAQIRLYASV